MGGERESLTSTFGPNVETRTDRAHPDRIPGSWNGDRAERHRSIIPSALAGIINVIVGRGGCQKRQEGGGDALPDRG